MYVKVTEKDARKSWRTLRALSWVGILAALVGIGWSGYMLTETARTSSWPSVQGSVWQCSAVPSKSGKRLTYNAEIIYKYTVNGQEYTGTQVRLRSNSLGAESEAQAFVNAHPIGGPVTVYYDPAHESIACLEVGMDKMFLLVAASAIAVLFVGIILAIHFRKAPPPLVAANNDAPADSATQ